MLLFMPDITVASKQCGYNATRLNEQINKNLTARFSYLPLGPTLGPKPLRDNHQK